MGDLHLAGYSPVLLLNLELVSRVVDQLITFISANYRFIFRKQQFNFGHDNELHNFKSQISDFYDSELSDNLPSSTPCCPEMMLLSGTESDAKNRKEYIFILSQINI